MEGAVDVGSLVAVLGAIVAGAAFAAIEAGLIALGDVRLRAMAERRSERPSDRAPDQAQVLAIERTRTRLLVARVLCVALAVALAAHVVGARSGVVAACGAGVLTAVAYAFLARVATSVARPRAERWVLYVVLWVRPLLVILAPLAAPLTWLGRTVERMLPPAPSDEPERVAELGLAQMIQEGREAGSIGADHAELLRSVLEFKNTVAHEVMVPRTQMVAIDLSTPLADVVELVIEKGHSRYPVYEERVDRVVGVLYAKDLFSLLRNGKRAESFRLADVMRKPAFFVAESQRIGTLLREMQVRRVHLAIVVDEFGGTAGIVTLEDILEEIVGEIRDEYDREETGVLELEQGRYLVDAGISVYDLEDQLGARIHEDGTDCDSVGGLVMELAGYVPAIGESVQASGFRLTVRDADQRRVRRVELTRLDSLEA